MAKSQPKVKEFKTERLASGEMVVIAVYEETETKRKHSVKCRGKQTSDFSLVGGWQRNPYKAPKC